MENYDRRRCRVDELLIFGRARGLNPNANFFHENTAAYRIAVIYRKRAHASFSITGTVVGDAVVC